SMRALIAAFAFALLLSLGGNALAQGGMGAMTAEKKVDKRKLTTIQTASVDVGGMKLAFASFKPAEANGTFLVPGNVFVEAPKDAVVVAEKEIAFGQGAPLVDQLSIWAGREGKTVSIKIHYGDRTLTEKLTLQ
ncbi:MAG: hypothetical protein LC747_08320, partial [Acidobacteria bacterium]|nr:hypothetical protein [Acidobacteriota bacterium]